MQAYGTQPRQTRPGFGSLAHRTMQLVANHFPVSCKLKEVCPTYYFTNPSNWLQRCSPLSTCTLFMHMVDFPRKMSTCFVHCQAFHYDVAIASVRRIDPAPETALEPGEAPEQLPGPPPIPPRPAKLLTSEMSRSVCAPRYGKQSTQPCRMAWKLLLQKNASK